MHPTFTVASAFYYVHLPNHFAVLHSILQAVIRLLLSAASVFVFAYEQLLKSEKPALQHTTQ